MRSTDLMALLESLATDALPPNDWKQLARACLSGGEDLLWNSDFAGFCQKTADLNHQQGSPITFEMLAGEGQYRDLQTQLNFSPAAYAQTNASAQKAWRKIPMPGKRAEELTKIVQGPDEPFQDCLSRLLQAAGRILGDSDAG